MSEYAGSLAVTATSSAGVSTAQAFGFPALYVKLTSDSTADCWLNVGSTTVTASTSAGYLFRMVAASSDLPRDVLELSAHQFANKDNLPEAVAVYVPIVAGGVVGTVRIYATDI